MARKKTTTKQTLLNSDDDSGEQTGEQVEDQAEGTVPLDGFERVRAAFGKDSEPLKMKVMRIDRDGSEGVLETFEWNPDVHGEDFLRARYGPGRYRLRFLNTRHRTMTTVTVTVSPLPEDASSLTASGGGGGMFDPLPYFMKEAERSREQFNQMVLAMLAKGSGGDGGGNEALVAMIKAQSDVNAAIMQRLLERPPAATGGIESVLKALELGMGAVSDIKSDSEGGWVSALRSIAKELGPALTEIVKQGQQRPGQPVAPGASAPAQVAQFPSAVPPAASPPSSVPVATEGEAMRGLLARYAPIALQAAKEGRAPTDFAATVLDSVGIAFHHMFDSVTSQDLVGLQPELANVKWKNPETGDERLWVDEVIDLLHTREWGDEEMEG